MFPATSAALLISQCQLGFKVLSVQAEKDAQARSHAVRMAELQESCHRKVQQLQAVHRQQLAAAQAVAADSLTAAAGPAAAALVAGDP